VALRSGRFTRDHPHYRWVALSNTTLGMLMATINASIVIISLPAIFKGINLNPLQPANVSYLLWILMGYMLVTAVLVEIQNDPPGDLNPPFHRRSFVRDDPGLDVVFILLGIEAEREE